MEAMVRVEYNKIRKVNLARKRKKTLDDHIVLDIIAVFAIIFALTILTGLFGQAGVIGAKLVEASKILTGYTTYILWVYFGLTAYFLFQSKKHNPNTRLLGVLFLIFGTATTQAAFSKNVNNIFDLSLHNLGSKGGLMGQLIANSLMPLTGPIMVFILSLGLLIIGVILTTGLTMREIIEFIKKHLPEKTASAPAVITEKEAVNPEKIKINESGYSNELPIKGQLVLGKALSDKKEDKGAMIMRVDQDWKYPTPDLLKHNSTRADAGNVKDNVKIIAETLEHFGIEVGMRDVNIGPTVSQYSLIPPTGVKLTKITSLESNLALALAAKAIRIEAPIPGKSLVGIEIPNLKPGTVRLKDILESKEYKEKNEKLLFGIGRDVAGNVISDDLAKMPHLLVAGATGAGKSVMINTLLVSLLYRNSPSELKLILVDPKRVEMTPYEDIPHLITPVIVEPDKTISALKWAVVEMEKRYKLLAEVGKRNILEYNSLKDNDDMPYIVIIIDELADLMAVASKEVESLIVRLAQKARAIGIHLVLATQRPSVDVITGVIKANVPARIAMTTASQIDSRTIIDQPGAEKLLGNGDMLYLSSKEPRPKRVQGVYLSDEEISIITDFLKQQRAPEYNEEILIQQTNFGGKMANGIAGEGGMGGADDDLFEAAVEAVIANRKASSSYLQRRLRIGYSRAARLIDILEERGVISGPDGSKPRTVLISSIDEVL